jgi:hypothetical protein
LDECGLKVRDVNYMDFVNHVEAVFERVVRDHYGQFVILTEPIVSQVTMTRLTDLFKNLFPVQYKAL